MSERRSESGIYPRRPRVLVIDDCPSTRAVYRGVFGADGFDVDEAGDGTSAVEKACLHHPDVVVVDYNMPEMDGGATVRALAARSTTRHIPVVVSTGSPEMVPLEIRVLAAALVPKPCDPDEIVAVVRALVPRSAIARAATR
jgi:CheY-like chemotaxis protein